MVRGEVLVVLILHVLFDNVLHLLRDDDDSNHPKPQCRLDYSSTFLHALESFQWLHDPIQEDSSVVEMVLLGKPGGLDTVRSIGVSVR